MREYGEGEERVCRENRLEGVFGKGRRRMIKKGVRSGGGLKGERGKWVREYEDREEMEFRES